MLPESYIEETRGVGISCNTQSVMDRWQSARTCVEGRPAQSPLGPAPTRTFPLSLAARITGINASVTLHVTCDGVALSRPAADPSSRLPLLRRPCRRLCRTGRRVSVRRSCTTTFNASHYAQAVLPSVPTYQCTGGER